MIRSFSNVVGNANNKAADWLLFLPQKIIFAKKKGRGGL
jgi:hypothetical protein